MSKREASLCDITISTFNKNTATCGELSIATCILCRSDVCEGHALHPKGGILLRVDSITPNPTVGQQQDLHYNPGSNQQTPYPAANFQTPTVRLQLCKGCRSLLSDSEIQDALRAIQEQFVKLLAASMSAKALAKTT